MQKRNRNRNRKMTGGFLDSITSSISSGWNSLSQGASNAWNKTKSAATTTYGSTTGSSSYTPASYTPTTTTPVTTATYGGKRRSRKMRGGFKSNTPTTGLAFAASPISGIKTAQPHNWVGGKTKKHHKRKHSKSHRHRKH